MTNMAKEKKLEGLGGWLILVGIGVILSPLRIIAQVLPIFSQIFSSDSWAVLTTPGALAYHPLWAPILLAEIGINSVLVLAWIYMAFLFFSKKKIFPKLFIGISVFTLVFILVDALAIKAILPDEPVFDPVTAREFLRSLVGTIIWVPYMLTSKRVKATFVG